MASSASVRDKVTIMGATSEQVSSLPANDSLPRREHSSPFPSSKAALRLRIYTALVLMDAAALCAAFTIANLVRFGDPLHRSGVESLIILLPIYGIIAFHSGSYSLGVLMSPKLGVKRALRSLGLAAAIVVLTLFYLKSSTDFSRVVMAVGTAGSLFISATLRWVVGQWVGKRLNWRFMNEVLLVDGVPVLPTRGEIVVFADEAGVRPSADDPVLMDRVGRLLKNCDRVIVACRDERRASWAAMMKGVDVNVEMFAPELEQLGALALGKVDQKLTVLVSRGPLGLRDRLVKRSFDLAVSMPLTILLAPALAAIAVAIKLDSPGPILFRQPRLGLGNRLFYILKFRSMRVEMTDNTASQLTKVNDPRVTKVGDFLRKTSLDELPQLINVLKGEMSLVGPRPHAVGALAGEMLYWDVDERYWDRHSAKPGITGLAQVRGYRGTTFESADLTNRLQADLEYLTDWSLWRDLGILAATAKVLLHRNAF